MIFHQHVRAIYDKLFREIAAVEVAVNTDKLDHVVQTARNLLEAVEALSSTTSREQRKLVGKLKCELPPDFRTGW
jgi:hypothetical protein